MPRRRFELSTSGETNIINPSTGEIVKKPSKPIVCERIQHYRKRLKMKKKVLGELVGVSGNVVGSWEAGRTRPGIRSLLKICDALHITIYDLYDIEDPHGQFTFTERHIMEYYRLLSDGHKHAIESFIDTLLTIEETERRSVIRQRICCDRILSACIVDPAEIKECGNPIFLYASRKVDEADYVFQVNGDSMEPEYHNGDMVLVKSIKNGSNLAYGEVGAFIIGNETYIRLYQRDGLYSLNPEYKIMEICDKDKVCLIGGVIGILDPSEIATQEDVEKYKSLHPDEFKE